MSCFSAGIARALFCLLLGLQAGPGSAAGQLDTRFGNQGVTRLLGLEAPGPQAMVVRPDRSIVFASARPTTVHDIILAGLTPSGRPDNRFAGGELLQIVSAGTLYRPLLQYDARTGKLLLAASDYRNGAYHLLLCRILADGTLDPSFTTAGYTSQTGCVSIAPPASAPSGVLVAGFQPLADGRILVGGSAYDFAANAFRAFEGQVTPLEISPNVPPSLNLVPNVSNVYISAVAFDPPNGDVYFTGSQRIGASDSALLVFRIGVTSIDSYLYNPNNVSNGAEDGRAIVFRNGNEIYVAGTVETADGKSDCMAFRLDRSMAPQFAFGPGSNGRRTVRFNGAALDSASCETVMTDAQGYLYVGGQVGLNGNQSYESAVAKLDSGGDFVGSFGINGVARLGGGQSPARSERVLTMALHNGRVLFGGPSDLAVGATPQTTDMVLARLTNDDVIFDYGFDGAP